MLHTLAKELRGASGSRKRVLLRHMHLFAAKRGTAILPGMRAAASFGLTEIDTVLTMRAESVFTARQGAACRQGMP